MSNSLMDLWIKVGVDTSEVNQKLPQASKQASAFGDTFKAILSSNVITKVFDLVVTGAQKALSAFTNFIKSAVSAYADYEQLVGGVQTIFKNASNTVINNAKNAYKTAGMSMNQYMEQVTSFSASLINGIANASNKVSEDTVNKMKKSSDAQLENKEKALDRAYEAARKMYDKEYEAARKRYDKEYEKASKHYNKKYEAARKASQQEYEALSESLDQEIKDYEKATDVRLKLIDKEYTEKMKLVDEDKYNRLKAVQDQIDALNDQADAEEKALEEREQANKIADLQSKVRNAKTYDEMVSAQEDLVSYQLSIQQKADQERVKAQIESLREQQEAIKEAASKRKETLKEQRDSEVEQVKESEADQLEEMRKSKEKQLEALKDSNEKSLQDLQESNSKKLKALQESNSDKLEAIRDSNAESLKALKDGYDKQLELAKKAASDHLAAFSAGTGKPAKVTAAQYEEAAKVADMALQDMSDNVNKMGTSMESVQAAYQGFSKGQYYLLDNLRLGYGGTKTEMERLLKDAEKLTGVKYDINNLADVYKAIHVIQKNLGITGTTAKESEKTVSGSISKLKAAWENLKIGLGDPNADMKELVNNVIESAESVIDNVLPLLGRILDGIGEMIMKIAPIIEEKAPGLIKKMTPMIVSILDALIRIIADSFTTLAPVIVDALWKLWDSVWDEILKEHPFLVVVRSLLEPGYAQKFIIKNYPIVGKLLIKKLAEGIASKFSEFKKNIKEKFDNIKRTISEVWENIKKRTKETWQNIFDRITSPIKAIKKFVSEKFKQIKGTFDEFKKKISNVFSTVYKTITAPFKKAWEKLSEIVEKIKKVFSFDLEFPKIKLPTFKLDGKFSLKPPSVPKIKLDWKTYAKAYDTPYLFTTPTLMPTDSGWKGFGDRPGGEIVYGRNQLMRDISQASRGGNTFNITLIANNQENPEEFAMRCARQLKMEMRMA